MTRAVFIDLGRRGFAPVWQLQKQYHARRVAGAIPDTLLLVEHDPVITLGAGGRRENLLVGEAELARRGVEFFTVERGGDITVHAPGQLVGYPIFALTGTLAGVRPFVRKLEQTIVRALGELGITADTVPGRTGVWVAGRKICSIGIAVRRWVTFHGFALNVDNDLGLFALVNPCGMPGIAMTSVQQELGRPVTVHTVRPAVVRAMADVFALDLIEGAP